MTRVLLASTGECLGTAARIQQDGLTVSCRHIFVDGGIFLDGTGWEEKLAFVASSPHDDIIFLQGEAQFSKTAGSWLACQCCATLYASRSVHLVPTGLFDLSRNKDYPCFIGPSGKHFNLTEKSLQIGRPVLLAGFPAASDEDFPWRPEEQPMITTGSICCYDRDPELAAATYQGGR